MIVEVADHPFVVFCEPVVCLPELVASGTLESTLAPGLSRLRDGVVESSLVEDFVDCSMADRGDLAACVVAEVAFYSVGSQNGSQNDGQLALPCPSVCVSYGSFASPAGSAATSVMEMMKEV